MAKCPNCATAIERQKNGNYPGFCPFCGLRLRAVAKKSAAGVQTAPVATSAVAERPSGKAENKGEPKDNDGPTGDNGRELLGVGDNPFAAPAAAPVAVANPLPDDNPFATNGAAAPLCTVAPALRKVGGGLASTGDVAKWVALAVLGVGLAIGGALLYRQATMQPAKPNLPAFENRPRNYVFTLPSREWQQRPKRQLDGRFDLAFENPAEKAWITLRTEEPKAEPSLPDLSEKAIKGWGERLRDFHATNEGESTRLAGQPAERVGGNGIWNGAKFRGETLVMAFGGVAYELSLEAPAESFSRLQKDCDRSTGGLTLMGLRDGTPRETVSFEEWTTVASKLYPYRLKTPRGWKESPGLETGRFDDIKLVDRSKLADVAIAPRRTADLAGMRTRYLDIQRKRFEGQIQERKDEFIDLTINGRPALRCGLVARMAEAGESFFQTTFVQGDGLVFQIQCRASAEKRDQFQPIFQKIVAGFEVLDKAPTLSTATVAKAEPPTQPPESTAAKKSDAEPAKAADAKAAKKSETSLSTASKKKNANDDLGDDAAMKPTPKEEKPKKGADTKSTPETKKKTKSNDDLD